MMLRKCCTQYASKFGKLSSGHRTEKGQFLFQSQRKAMNAKECSIYHTIALISHTSKVMLKILKVCELWNFRCSSWIYKRQRNQRSNCQHWLDQRKSKRVPEKCLLLLYWLCQCLCLCRSQQTVENSYRDGNTRLPDLPPEKYVCRSGSNSWNWTWNNRLVPNWETSMSRLYIVTLLI